MPFDLDAFERRVRRAFLRARLADYLIDFGPYELRFELGDEKPNGAIERVGQAVDRAVKLFEACNTRDDDIVVVCKDFDGPGQIFPSRPPRYLLSLICNYDSTLGVEYAIDPDDYCEVSYKQIVYPTKVRYLACEAIFRGIASTEQGRSPCVGASVYLVNVTRNVVFFMYDDRGCLVSVDRPEKLLPLYKDHNSWLVDCGRPLEPEWMEALRGQVVDNG